MIFEGIDRKRETAVRSALFTRALFENPFITLLLKPAAIFKSILPLPIIPCQTIFTDHTAVVSEIGAGRTVSIAALFMVEC